MALQFFTRLVDFIFPMSRNLQRSSCLCCQGILREDSLSRTDALDCYHALQLDSWSGARRKGSASQEYRCKGEIKSRCEIEKIDTD